MKKFLSIILISFMVMAGIFAATATAPQSETEWKAKSAPNSEVTVALTVDPAKMHSYAFGFTNKTEAVDLDNKLGLDDFSSSGLPVGAASEFVLEYDPVTSTGSNGENNPLVLYYKVRNNSDVSITLKITDTLTAASGDMATGGGKLGWQVVGTKLNSSSDDQTVGSGGSFTLSSDDLKETVITIKQPSTSGQTTTLKWLTCNLAITTKPVSALLSAKTKYTGTITLGITPA